MSCTKTPGSLLVFKANQLELESRALEMSEEEPVALAFGVRGPCSACPSGEVPLPQPPIVPLLTQPLHPAQYPECSELQLQPCLGSASDLLGMLMLGTHLPHPHIFSCSAPLKALLLLLVRGEGK